MNDTLCFCGHPEHEHFNESGAPSFCHDMSFTDDVPEACECEKFVVPEFDVDYEYSHEIPDGDSILPTEDED